MMKISGIVLTVLLGSVVLVVVIGYALPKKHVAARAISLRQGPAEVFALISNFKEAPAWRPDVRAVELLPPVGGHIRFLEKGKNGEITMEVTEMNSPQRLVTRIADPKLPFGGSWIFEILPAADGCRLNITERGDIYNPVFRFVSRFILGYTATLDTYLKNVARKFGSTAVPEDGMLATGS
jgi:polyketide cyclase/dehydrase/lipid transport protein